MSELVIFVLNSLGLSAGLKGVTRLVVSYRYGKNVSNEGISNSASRVYRLRLMGSRWHLLQRAMMNPR